MWIKICGIRDAATALDVARAGVDAIGLNFFAGSPRVVAPAIASEIIARLPAGVEPVGLFVNHSADEIRDIGNTCRLRTIQLHGDEPPEFLQGLAEFHVIRAFRVGEAGLREVAGYLEKCRELGCLPWACLIDAQVRGAYGGTGQVAPWTIVRAQYRFADWPRLILAGGLVPANVAVAIREVQPWGVDVAGGVESTVACKDAGLVRQFVENARTASAAPDRG